MIAELPFICPIVLAGGEGLRLWPLSTPNLPKQFLSLLGDLTLFQKTLLRLSLLNNVLPPIVVVNRKFKKMAKIQMKALGIKGSLLIEPCSKNTAIAISLAVVWAQKSNPESLVLVLPCDHLMQDESAFVSSVERALKTAQAGGLCLFGVKPLSAHTGYGYIEVEKNSNQAVYEIKRFVEKPSQKRAEAFYSSPRYYWNAGIFLFKPRAFFNELQQFAPEIMRLSQALLPMAPRLKKNWLIASSIYQGVSSLSIDYALFEKTKNRYLILLDTLFIDLGTWLALFMFLKKDANNNVIKGLVHVDSVKNALIDNQSPLHLIVSGLEDIVVCITKAGILIAKLDPRLDLKKIWEEIAQSKSDAFVIHDQKDNKPDETGKNNP